MEACNRQVIVLPILSFEKIQYMDHSTVWVRRLLWRYWFFHCHPAWCHYAVCPPSFPIIKWLLLLQPTTTTTNVNAVLYFSTDYRADVLKDINDIFKYQTAAQQPKSNIEVKFTLNHHLNIYYYTSLSQHFI